MNVMKAGMISASIAVPAVLCSLPARGNETLLPPRVVNALTPRDTLPTKAVLDEVFASPVVALDSLRQIALDPSIDPGIALRAIRVLPAYCPPEPDDCGPGTTVHDTLHLLIERHSSALVGETDQLRLRAAIEALGTTRSGLSLDAEKLGSLLRNTSRDVRATVVRAMRSPCNPQTIDSLSSQLREESSAQVKHEINAVLREMRKCN